MNCIFSSVKELGTNVVRLQAILKLLLIWIDDPFDISSYNVFDGLVV